MAEKRIPFLFGWQWNTHKVKTLPHSGHRVLYSVWVCRRALTSSSTQKGSLFPPRSAAIRFWAFITATMNIINHFFTQECTTAYSVSLQVSLPKTTLSLCRTEPTCLATLMPHLYSHDTVGNSSLKSCTLNGSARNHSVQWRKLISTSYFRQTEMFLTFNLKIADVLDVFRRVEKTLPREGHKTNLKTLSCFESFISMRIKPRFRLRLRIFLWLICLICSADKFSGQK